MENLAYEGKGWVNLALFPADVFLCVIWRFLPFDESVMSGSSLYTNRRKVKE